MNDVMDLLMGIGLVGLIISTFMIIVGPINILTNGVDMPKVVVIGIVLFMLSAICLIGAALFGMPYR